MAQIGEVNGDFDGCLPCLAGFRLDHDTADCIFEQGILYTKSALGDAGQCFSNNDVPQKSLCA